MGDPFAGLHPELALLARYAVAYMQLYTGGAWDGNQITGGVKPTITSVWRSRGHQQDLYDQRATNPYPVNRPGDSAHGVMWQGSPSALAFDSDVPDAYQPLWRQIRTALGFRVPDNDDVHAEWPNWRAIVASDSRWST